MLGDEGAVGFVAQQHAAFLIDGCFEAVALAFCFKCVGAECFESNFGSVAQVTFAGNQVLASRAIDQRVRAAGIVADHAADHRTVGGGRLRAKQHAVRQQCVVELVAHDPWLHAHAAILGID